MSNFVINPYTSSKTETTIYSQTASGSNMITFWGTIYAGGLCIKSGDSLVGESVTKVTFKLYKSGTPSATTLYARVFNTASALTVKHTFGSLAVSELTDTGVDHDFESASSYTIVANDVIAIYVDNSGSSHGDHINQAGTSGSTSTLKYGDYDGGWSSTGNQRPYLIMIEIS
tara:strand:+ start:268 stop:783 length:516 start_codon:yes stop_codon:yes gene_type:complete